MLPNIGASARPKGASAASASCTRTLRGEAAHARRSRRPRAAPARFVARSSSRRAARREACMLHTMSGRGRRAPYARSARCARPVRCTSRAHGRSRGGVREALAFSEVRGKDVARSSSTSAPRASVTRASAPTSACASSRARVHRGVDAADTVVQIRERIDPKSARREARRRHRARDAARRGRPRLRSRATPAQSSAIARRAI